MRRTPEQTFAASRKIIADCHETVKRYEFTAALMRSTISGALIRFTQAHARLLEVQAKSADWLP